MFLISVAEGFVFFWKFPATGFLSPTDLPLLGLFLGFWVV